MSFAHRVDAVSGVEGWIDADAARAWAVEAQRRFALARAGRDLASFKAEIRAGLLALDNATAALNLPQSQGSGDVLTRSFPFGLDRIDLNATSNPAGEYSSKNSLFAATFGGIERARDWALAQPLGDYPLQAPNGVRFVVRVFDGADGAKSYAVLPDPAAVLAFQRSLPPSSAEQRAARIAGDPWGAYLESRRAIDATNEQRARWWGLTTPAEIAGFQVASDAVNNALSQEWTNTQRERVRAKFNEITDDIAAKAAMTGVGAPIAAIFKALQLLGGVLPWVTEEPPPGAVSRVRSGGVGESEPPRHTVPVPPVPALGVLPFEVPLLSDRSGGASVGGANTRAGLGARSIFDARASLLQPQAAQPGAVVSSSQSSMSAPQGVAQGSGSVRSSVPGPVVALGAAAAVAALVLYLSRSK